MFHRSVEPPRPAAAATTTKGERIYAIGDIHGRYDLLCELIEKLERHSASLPAPRSLHIVLLGDLVDRGPASADVLRFAYDARDDQRIITLLGNHEELMLRALKGEPGALRAWLRVGGKQTLESFGIEPPARDDDPVAAVAAINRRIPRALIEWLGKRPLTARSGDYLFCHAGIRPGVPLKRQTRADLLWIRDEFIEDQGDHGVVVVHGHNRSVEVEERVNRIGIDTGAYASGVLTALCLEGTKREFISTDAPVAVEEAAV